MPAQPPRTSALRTGPGVTLVLSRTTQQLGEGSLAAPRRQREDEIKPSLGTRAGQSDAAGLSFKDGNASLTSEEPRKGDTLPAAEGFARRGERSGENRLPCKRLATFSSSFEDTGLDPALIGDSCSDSSR